MLTYFPSRELKPLQVGSRVEMRDPCSCFALDDGSASLGAILLGTRSALILEQGKKGLDSSVDKRVCPLKVAHDERLCCKQIYVVSIRLQCL